MSNSSKRKLHGIKLPVKCPECGGTCSYIQVGKHGNLLTKEAAIFVAFYGCKPCVVVNAVDCNQGWGAEQWEMQQLEDKMTNRLVSRVDEFFEGEFE